MCHSDGNPTVGALREDVGVALRRKDRARELEDNHGTAIANKSGWASLALVAFCRVDDILAVRALLALLVIVRDWRVGEG